MIGQSLAHMDIAALQKAVLGMDPAIKPYAALAALQEKVKSQQMKQGQALQNPAQPPVAQQTMAQAQQLSPAQISNPYMASGLGAAPVQSPVQEPATGMASGGIVAFKVRDLVLDVQQLQFVQQVVPTDVTLVKVVGVILGIQVSIPKKVHLTSTILFVFMMKTLISRK